MVHPGSQIRNSGSRRIALTLRSRSRSCRGCRIVAHAHPWRCRSRGDRAATPQMPSRRRLGLHGTRSARFARKITLVRKRWTDLLTREIVIDEEAGALATTRCHQRAPTPTSSNDHLTACVFGLGAAGGANGAWRTGFADAASKRFDEMRAKVDCWISARSRTDEVLGDKAGSQRRSQRARDPGGTCPR